MLKNAITITILAALVQSCAFYSGTMSSNAAIPDAKFTVIGYAHGVSKSHYVFGMGGLAKDGMVLEAKRNMYKAYPLKQGQVFANITVDFKRGFYVFFATTVCTITADIIDFNNQSLTKNYNFINFTIAKSTTIRESDFKVGEQVYYSETPSSMPIGSTITALNDGSADIRFVKPNGIIDYQSVHLSELYKIVNDTTLKNLDQLYQIGDSIYFSENQSSFFIRGQIFALGYTEACIVYNNGEEKNVAIVNKEQIRTMKTREMEELKNGLAGNWKLMHLGETKVIDNDQTPTLAVDIHDMKISGFGGCNRYFGNFSIGEFAVTISAIGSTRMACEDGNIENEYFKALGNQSFNINRNENTLILKNDQNELEFQKIQE